MPRRGAALRARPASRHAARSMLLRCVGVWPPRAGRFTLSPISHAGLCHRSQIDVAGGVLLSRRRRREPWRSSPWAVFARSWPALLPRAPRGREAASRRRRGCPTRPTTPARRGRSFDAAGMPPGAFPQRLRKKGSIEVDLTEHTAKLVQTPAVAPQPQPSPAADRRAATHRLQPLAPPAKLRKASHNKSLHRWASPRPSRGRS